MRKQDIEQERKYNTITPLFFDKCPRTNLMRENRCSRSEGLLLLSSGKFWIHLWIPQRLFSYIERNIGKNICVITSHNVWEKSWLIQSLDEVPLAGPTLPLRIPHTNAALAPLGTVSPNYQIDFLPEVTALNLLVSHPGSWLLKLTLLQNFGLCLTLCANSTWPRVSLCVRVDGSLSASLC